MSSTTVFGSVFVDVKGFSSAHYVPSGRNIGQIEFVHGGVCRNVCENFANQGIPVTFVSMVEDTAIGRDVRERLEKRGADLRYTINAENGMGMWLAILDENGDLAGSISKQPDFTMLETLIREKGDEIVSQTDNIVLEIDMNESIAAHLLQLARKHQKPVYSIVGNLGVILKHPEYLKQVQCFICNEIEAGKLFGADFSNCTPEAMLSALIEGSQRLGIRSMVVTMGAQGAVFCDHSSGEKGFCPVIPSKMVDSSGAGDAFFSGTVMSLTRGARLSKAVQIGTLLASETIQCSESTCHPIENLWKE